MSSSKCPFTCICGIFWPVNPSTTTVYARSAFFPSLHFTLSLQSAFYTQSAFYPYILPLVRSLQSAVRSLPFTLTVKEMKMGLCSCCTHLLLQYDYSNQRHLGEEYPITTFLFLFSFFENKRFSSIFLQTDQ